VGILEKKILFPPEILVFSLITLLTTGIWYRQDVAGKNKIELLS
jgi:hypothetical protein